MVSAKDIEEWIASNGVIPLDLYAQNPRDWHPLSALIPGIIISSAGGVIPFQAEGLLRELPFYYRDRHGVATLAVGSADSTAFGNDVLYRAEIESVEFEGGKVFLNNLLNLIPRLSRSPICWEFPCKKLQFANDGSYLYDVLSSSDASESMPGWGHTAEEGYLAAQVNHATLESHGIPIEQVEQMWEDMDVRPTPLNADKRIFPNPEPEFQVRVPEAWKDTKGLIAIPDDL